MRKRVGQVIVSMWRGVCVYAFPCSALNWSGGQKSRDLTRRRVRRVRPVQKKIKNKPPIEKQGGSSCRNRHDERYLRRRINKETSRPDAARCSLANRLLLGLCLLASAWPGFALLRLACALQLHRRRLFIIPNVAVEEITKSG